MNQTKVLSIFHKWKDQKKFFILLPAFYILMCLMKSSFFFKSSHFEIMRVGFPLGCQNSLQWNTPETDAFSGMHFLAPLIVIVLTKCSLCFMYLDDFWITFWARNIFKRQLLLPWVNISMANQTEVNFDTWKLFGDFMKHIIRYNAVKK